MEKLLSDDEFISKIIAADSAEAVKRLFEEKGVRLTDEQIESIRSEFIKSIESVPKGELEKISGGRDEFEDRVIKDAGMGGTIGMWVGAGAGATAAFVKSVINACKKGKFSPTEFLTRQMQYILVSGAAGAALGAGFGAAGGAMANCGGVGDDRKSKDKSEASGKNSDDSPYTKGALLSAEDRLLGVD